MGSIFEKYWNKYSSKSQKERREYLNSLSRPILQKLIDSFLEKNRDELVSHNFVNHIVDYINSAYNVNLLEIRIQTITQGRVYLVRKEVWEYIEELTWQFVDHYDLDTLFGGLLVETWGKAKQFCRIRAVKDKWR